MVEAAVPVLDGTGGVAETRGCGREVLLPRLLLGNAPPSNRRTVEIEDDGILRTLEDFVQE
jgi:hypothetical protein